MILSPNTTSRTVRNFDTMFEYLVTWLDRCNQNVPCLGSIERKRNLALDLLQEVLNDATPLTHPYLIHAGFKKLIFDVSPPFLQLFDHTEGSRLIETSTQIHDGSRKVEERRGAGEQPHE